MILGIQDKGCLMVFLHSANGASTDDSAARVHYLPVDDATAARGMYLTGTGRAMVRPGELYPLSGQPPMYQCEWLRGRILPEFQIVLVTDGKGEFESQPTGCVNIEGSTLLFLFPGVWHRYRPAASTGWTERWISFHGELIQRQFEFAAIGPALAVGKPADPVSLAAEFDNLLQALDVNSTRHPAMLMFQALRTIALSIAQRLHEAAESGALWQRSARMSVVDPIVQKAVEIIWSHGHHAISVGDISRELPVTRRTLDRRFMEATGHSVLEEINACRFSRAKRLLAETELPIKTVTHLAGFSSTERMRVAFVEREGVSPTTYRRRAATCRRRPHEVDGARESPPRVLKKGQKSRVNR
jgi:AraC-like DNA-binding protein